MSSHSLCKPSYNFRTLVSKLHQKKKKKTGRGLFTLKMEMREDKSRPVECITAIHKAPLTMNILFNDSKFQEKLQLYSIAQSCRYLNYTQHLILSDSTEQSPFNDGFHFLFGIYWRALMWVAGSGRIGAPVTFPHLMEAECGDVHGERLTSRCVLVVAAETIYSQHRQKVREPEPSTETLLILSVSAALRARSPTFIWPMFGQNSGIDLASTKMPVRLSHWSAKVLLYNCFSEV